MAKEVFFAREYSVNPLNAIKSVSRRNVQTEHLDETYSPSKVRQYLFELGFNERQVEGISKALVEYTTLDEVTERLYYQHKDIGLELARISTLMDVFTDKAPKWHGGTTYRGVPIASKEALKIFKKGSVIDTELVSGHSWTTERRVAEGYGEFETVGHKGVATILVCEGPQHSGTSIRHLSRHWGEHEVYVASGAKHVVTKVEQIPTKSGIGKTTIVYVKSVK